jgi:LytS/YehU family sensor histidine kinase
MHGFAITSNDANLDAIDIALIFVSFIIVVLIFSFFVKLYYRIRHNKRYYIFPRIGIKGIANIAMVISIAVAAILLLTLLTAGFLGVIFRAYPGWRIVVEGILIKIGGLLFGPMIGLFIGGCTDLLSIALTSGMFHYGYFIAAVFYGFFAGLIRSLLNFCKKQQVEFIFIGSILSVVIMLASIIYISTYPGNIFDITFLIHISMPK